MATPCDQDRDGLVGFKQLSRESRRPSQLVECQLCLTPFGLSNSIGQMIKSFRDKALARFHATGETRGLKIVNAARVQRLLDVLDRARRPEALNAPGLGFHRLKGTRRDTYAVSVSGNWRLTFKCDGEGAIAVNVEDYH